jgi:hypothetical protein
MLPSFKTQAILDVYNYLNPDAQLKDWSKSKSELVGRITSKFDQTQIEKAIAATENGEVPGKKGKVVKVAKAAKKGKAKGKSAKSAKAEGTPRGEGIGTLIRAMLKAQDGISSADVVTAVLKSYPDAKTNAACVSWYRSKMYKTGQLVRA